MELEKVADTLDKTLMEEEDTDQLLTDIAENDINFGAEIEGLISLMAILIVL
jgi:ferritin-like metal-binding protein YciE